MNNKLFRKRGLEKLKLLNLFNLLKLLKLFTLFTLIFSLLPADVMAEFGRRDRGRMPKYSLWGDIGLQYKSSDIKGGRMSSVRSSEFTQDYRLNFKSYVLSPKVMQYTINTGLNKVTGNMYSKGTPKTYGIETLFFQSRPLNFSLRASKTDGSFYKNSDYGLSMNYTRKAPPRRREAAPSPVEGEGNVNRNEGANLNTNTNLNTNANLNANNEGDYEYDANANTARKPKAALKPRPEGLFSSITNNLPYNTHLDIDRTKNKSGGSEESKWDSAALRFGGLFLRKTLYGLHFDYHKWTQGGTSATKGSGAELTTHTPLKWSFFQEFKNYAAYRKNHVKAMNINSWLTGIKAKRRYEIYANYLSASNGESAKQYSILADVQNAVPYTYKRAELFYDAGIGFERLRNKNDLFAKGRLSAQKRIGLNTNLNSSLGLRAGTEHSEADFLTGVSYTFTPRKGYVVSIEIDPLKESLKTQTFKPQVYGWDYSVTTGYTFGLSKNFNSEQTNKTITSHRGDLNLRVYLRKITLLSNAFLLLRSDSGKIFQWDNSIFTRVMEKVGVTIGTALTMDTPKAGEKKTSYNIYNLITYNLSRRSLLTVNSRYTKTTPDNKTRLEILPSIAWKWRLVTVDLELGLIKDKTNGGEGTTEKKVMLRMTRPFKIL